MDGDRFIDFNDTALEMFDVESRDELLRSTPMDISPPFQHDGRSSREKAEELIEKAMEGNKLSFEWVHKKIRSNKDFHTYVTLSKIRLEGKDVLHAIVKDVDALKREAGISE